MKKLGLQRLQDLTQAIEKFGSHIQQLEIWAQTLSEVLFSGGRFLVAGNGGSASQAQHLAAELVGRYCDDRTPFSALALHMDTASFTAISNDYGFEEAFARQVRAHGRKGDIFLGISTSGSSPNVLLAAQEANRKGLITWALTGSTPNDLTVLSQQSIQVQADSTATIQEVHQVAIHLLCEAFDSNIETLESKEPIDLSQLSEEPNAPLQIL